MIKVINVYKDSRVMEMTSSSNLGLGVKTDNDVDLLRFTFDEMIVGTATLLTSLTDDNGDLVAFPLTINEEENSYDLEVTKYVASQTNYTIQLEIVKDTTIWHSKQADIILDECLEVGEGEMPTTIENWLQNANLVMSGYQDKIDEWETEVEQAVTGAENVNIEVEEGQDLYNVTITDREGNEYQAVIYQGKNAIISGATASVDNTVGTPSVNVIMGGTESDRTFDFAFHNLKGEQGDKGDKGDPGAIKFEIVEQLPTTDIEEDTIYLVPITPDTDDNNYEEYIYVNGEWELLGKIGVHVDLTDYYTKSETNTLLNAKENTSNKVTSISSSSTNTQYPSAKCVYDSQATQDTKITNLENQVFGDETIDGEGTSLALNGTLKGKFNSIDLKGNTSQDGTPTPTSPIPVNVVSGDNEILIQGKNLFGGYYDIDVTRLGIQTIASNDEITTSGTTNNTGWLFNTVNRPKIYLIAGTYTFSINNFIGTFPTIMNAVLKDEADTNIFDVRFTTTLTQTFTISTNGSYYFDLYMSTNNASFNSSFNIQIEKGSPASNFETYQSNNYDIDLGVYLPNTYTPVEYIGTSGTQYIDTGYQATGSLKIEGKVYTEQSNTEMCVCGVTDTNAQLEIGFSSTNNRFFNYSGSASAAVISTESLYNKVFNFIAEVNDTSPKKKITLNVDNNISATNDTNNGNYKANTITLFTVNNGFFFKGRLYKLDIYDDNVLKRRLVPCYRNSDNVIGLYDIVGNTFYTNSGTGTFTKGNDVENGMELCKIGNYQDYFYKEDDKWYKYEAIRKYTFTGDSGENWTLASNDTNTSRFYITFNTINSGDGNDENVYVLSKQFLGVNFKSIYSNTALEYVISNYNGTSANHRIHIRVPNNIATTSSALKTWLSTNNIETYSPHLTPTTTQITYQPLIDQLNELEKAQSKENQTNISQVNNDLPFIISASAFLNNINGKIALLNKLTEV